MTDTLSQSQDMFSVCTGVLLVGTRDAVDQLRASLMATDSLLQVQASLIFEENDLDDSAVCLDLLQQQIHEQRLPLVLLSLPMCRINLAGKIISCVQQAGGRCRWIPMLSEQFNGCMPGPLGKENTGRGEAIALTSSKPMPPLQEDDPWLDTVRLINREPRPLDEKAIGMVISNRTVMITGAGGSIGSELAHIVCRFNPAKLILVERSENALFEIDRRLDRDWPHQLRQVVLHDITDASRTRAMVGQWLPDVIFHAAAHKHVPMMEQHPTAAVENNFFGTRSIADAADAHQVGRFVMISSDKAVNPSSVMGATKRMAERYIQWLNHKSQTVFAMVRFGNVLGSACSVLPIWTQQLARGGPLTVTHPDMTRYFMTIPEAAGLVIQSAAYASGGEVFLLDMGQPVRILDLCERFIRMHGYQPRKSQAEGMNQEIRDAGDRKSQGNRGNRKEILIQVTGIRPGEKLFEELAYTGEDMLPTPHPSIRLWKTTPPMHARMQQIIRTFEHLRDKHQATDHHWQHADHAAVLAAIHRAVPEMQTDSRHAVAG